MSKTNKKTSEKQVKKEMKIGELKLQDIASNSMYLVSLHCCGCDRSLTIGKMNGLDVERLIDNYSVSINKLRCQSCKEWVNYYLLIIEVKNNEQKQVRIDRKQNNGGKQ